MNMVVLDSTETAFKFEQQQKKKKKSLLKIQLHLRRNSYKSIPATSD